MNIDYMKLLLFSVVGIISGCSPSEESLTQHVTKPIVRPNFLWLTIEDTSAYEFGCYGNTQVNTPNVDALAARGVRFTNASSTAPHCSPARSTLISGTYATTYGSDFHRRRYPSSSQRLLYPDILKQAGYYSINVKKRDYNIDPRPMPWDEGEEYASLQQPFFAVYNTTRSHMASVHSQKKPGANIPASDIDISHLKFLPDLPEIRADYAWHLKAVEDIDRWVGEKLDELEASGKADDTIIFFYSDHGGCQPRGKAYPYESGLRVPLIIYVPPKFRHLWQEFKPGATDERLIGFEDFAPTVFSMIGIEPPESMQGKALWGAHAQPAKRYQFGFRTNQGIHFDPIRTVRDERFKYIRNFIPYKPLGVRQGYQWGMKANQAMDHAYLKGELAPRFARFFEPKETEELYDLKVDPDEMNNLAEDPAYAAKLKELRAQVSAHIRETRDLGFFSPQSRLWGEVALYDWVRDNNFPLDELHALAETASLGDPEKIPQLGEYLTSEHASLRYWAASGLATIASRGHSVPLSTELSGLLNDSDPDVAAVAAVAHCYSGDAERGVQQLVTMIEQEVWQEAASSLHVYLMQTGKVSAVEPHLDRLKTLAAVEEGLSNWKPLFYYRAILIDLGINTPLDLYRHEKWKSL